MKKHNLISIILLLLTLTLDAYAQKEKAAPVCRQTTFAALKSLPKLEYVCPEGLSDYDEKILKLPERLAAIRRVVKELEHFTTAAWWQSSVDELNACKVHGSGGDLTEEEKQQWKRGDYNFDLLGNHQMRLVLLADPCYQTGFAGANAFLLYRDGARVVVSQVLNGYYSRVDNSVGIDFANLNGQQLIEISTANSMPPSLVSYFFIIDPTTKMTAPKKIFKEGGKLTNEISSAMLMGEPPEFGFPRGAVELKIIQANRLAPSFSSYTEGAGDRQFRRIVYRWNGRFYVSSSARQH